MYRLLYLCLCVSALLMGCQSGTNTLFSPSKPLAVNALPASIGLSGSHSVWLSDNRFVIASEGAGLHVQTVGGDSISQISGSFEGLDSRFIGQQWLLATVDQESGDIVFFRLSAKGLQFEQVGAVNTGEFLVDALCFYQSPMDNALYLIVSDGDGRGEQYLLLTTPDGNYRTTAVRRLPLPPNSGSCAADDSRGLLYIAEQDIGIWSYSAEPEQQLERQLIDIMAPRGTLQGDIEGLAISTDGGLWAVANNSLYRFLQNTGQRFTTAGDYAFESIAVNAAGRGLVYDEKADQYLLLTLPVTAAGKTRQSLSLVKDSATEPLIKNVVASAETTPVDRFGDAADDPAIWINRQDPTRSLVLGTHKRKGLYVYNLAGEQRQFIASGRLNNIDLRYGFQHGQQTLDIAVASNRSDNSLSVFTIDPVTLRVLPIGNIPTTLKQIYGLCLYQPDRESLYAFVNDKEGRYQQFELHSDGNNLYGKRVRQLRLKGIAEGCVADDVSRLLFAAEENVGVWKIGADPDSGQRWQSVIKTGGPLVADVEGLAIARGEEDYLLVSSQGNNSYSLYTLAAPHRYVGSFRVGMNADSGIDGSSETDGLELVTANLGGVYSDGLLVVQDGYNIAPEQPQNFKYIAWRSVKQVLALP